MGMMRALSGLTAIVLIAGCSSAYDPYLKTGSNDHYSHEIEVVEDTAILEVAMSEAEPGIPYFERQFQSTARGARNWKPAFRKPCLWQMNMP